MYLLNQLKKERMIMNAVISRRKSIAGMETRIEFEDRMYRIVKTNKKEYSVFSHEFRPEMTKSMGKPSFAIVGDLIHKSKGARLKDVVECVKEGYIS